MKTCLENQLHEVQNIPKGYETNRNRAEIKEYGSTNESIRIESGSIKKYEDQNLTKQNNALIRFQDENILLKNENESLKNLKKSLEAEILNLKKHNTQNDFDINTKIAAIQEEKQTNLVLYQHEKAASERLRNLLQQKIDELALKEKGND